jgi:hypothetical protein
MLMRQHMLLTRRSAVIYRSLSFSITIHLVQVSAFDDPHEACLSVVAESYRLWLNYETRTDDITMIVLQFSGLDTPQRPPPGSLHRLVDKVSSTWREIRQQIGHSTVHCA